MSSQGTQTILITGAGGWLGSLLPLRLVEQERERTFCFILADIDQPKIPKGLDESNVITLQADLTNATSLDELFSTRFAVPEVIYSMHGIMSLGSEEDWDLGIKVNLDSTRSLLEKARHSSRPNNPITFIFTSSVASYGGQLPDVVLPSTTCTPEGAYGTAKLICEYLVTEYSRKGFINGISIKLPTVVPRPGAPSRATSAFVSGIVREPLSGKESICPIGDSIEDPTLQQVGVWVASPSTTLSNFVRAKQILQSPSSVAKMMRWSRSVQLPGFTVTVQDIIEALRNVQGEKAIKLIKFQHDETCKRLVSSWPQKFDNSYALDLGFIVDTGGYEGCIEEYKRDNL